MTAKILIKPHLNAYLRRYFLIKALTIKKNYVLYEYTCIEVAHLPVRALSGVNKQPLRYSLVLESHIIGIPRNCSKNHQATETG